MSWLLGRGEDGTHHIVPLDDLDGHVTRDETCRCQPELNENGHVVHNAFDGREAYERGERKLH